jgi:hypothetical protein
MFKPEEMIGKDPETLIKMTKKGQTMMMFATVSGNPTKRETEEISQIWWTALKNALYDITKYVYLEMGFYSKKISFLDTLLMIDEFYFFYKMVHKLMKLKIILFNKIVVKK